MTDAPHMRTEPVITRLLRAGFLLMGRTNTPAVEAAVGAVNSGPLGANAVPASVPGPGGKLVPFNPLKDVAFHAYSIGYVVCAVAALLAAAVAVAAVGGRAHETLLDPHTLSE
jgi:type IV secretory pathway protease TraF